MSAVASGLGKIFASVGSTAAKISSSVVGIGKAAFTAGAATGAGPMASGGLNGIIQSVAGDGVFGNILNGAVNQAVKGAMIGAVGGLVTGQGAGKGALIGAGLGAATGGLGAAWNGMSAAPAAGSTTPAVTPTGFAPTGSTASTTAPNLQTSPNVAAAPPGANPPTAQPASTGLGAGVKGFFSNELVGGALAGLGQGMQRKMEIDALRDEKQADRDWQDARQSRITDSYNVNPNAYQSKSPAAQPQTPRQAAGLPTFAYDPKTGGIEMVAA